MRPDPSLARAALTALMLVSTFATATEPISPHFLATAQPTGWFLMARHGECAPLATLARTFPDIGDIRDPDAFVRFVRAKGLAVSTNRHPLPTGAAMEVSVPEKSLSLIFVSAELCASHSGRKR